MENLDFEERFGMNKLSILYKGSDKDFQELVATRENIIAICSITSTRAVVLWHFKNEPLRVFT